MAESKTIAAFRRIADRLRADTSGSRITIRIDCASLGLEIETVAVESRDDSASALEGQRTPNARESAAIRWLCANRRTFVMDDCLNPWDSEVAPEHYVINLYGIRSEMVSGVFRGETLVGVISVHYSKGPRSWRDEEVGMIEAACREVLAVIDAHEKR